MGLRLGSSTPTALYLGDRPVQRVYLGTELVWSAQSAYELAALADSPLGLWLMDELSGTTMVDSSGHGIHGTYTSTGVTLGATGPAGLPRAAGYDGSTGSASVAINLSAYNTVTIEFALWTPSWPSGTQLVYEYGNPSTSLNGLYGNADSAGMWASATTGGDSRSAGRRAARPSTGAWHFFSVVHARGGWPDIRINGADANSTTWNENSVTGNFANLVLTLMSRGGTSLFRPGRMAGLAIYPGALSNARRDAHASIALTGS